MSSEPKAGATAAPRRQVPAALRPLIWMGIPESVLSWKPRLPSRNWSIFFASVAAVSFLYYDDRRQCRKIMDEYKERVRGLAEDPLHPQEMPRKVTVYTARYPGEPDYDASVLYFKRFIKPVLVAAAVDFEIISGTRHGSLARELRDKIHERRRNLAGVQPWSFENVLTASLQTPMQHLKRELEGGIVLIGRPALKEWAWALREGWSPAIPATPVDRDEILASELASNDSVFEEEDTAAEGDENDPETTTPVSPAQTGFMLPSQIGLQSMQKGGPMPFAAPSTTPAVSTPAATPAKEDMRMLEPLVPIPAQPPICFVDFTNLAGWRNIPRRVGRFFYRREQVRQGCEAALAIVLGSKNDAREFDPGAPHSIPADPPQGHDLDWGLEEESYYPPAFDNTPHYIERERKSFYDELKKELKASRELSRGEREPTRSEKNEMPRSEVELREQRFKRENGWRDLDEGYHIVRPQAGVAWDEAWRGSLRVLRPRTAEERVPRRVTPEVEDEQPGEQREV